VTGTYWIFGLGAAAAIYLAWKIPDLLGEIVDEIKGLRRDLGMMAQDAERHHKEAYNELLDIAGNTKEAARSRD